MSITDSVARRRNISGVLIRSTSASLAPSSSAADFDAELPSAAALSPRSAHQRSRLQIEPFVHILKGAKAILAVTELLHNFAVRCEQTGAMEDIAYFLSKPGFLERIPQLMLISKSSEITSETLLGALLLFEYRVLNCGLRMYTTNDRSGRNTLVAPRHLRSSVARFATQMLLNRGAHLAMITYREDLTADAPDAPYKPGKVAARWARRDREIAEYLPLEKTYDATLAGIGQRTRSNMRYYRRRSEKELGCTFVPFVEISKADFLAFNRQCMFAVPDDVAAWRYDTLQELSQPLLMGMRDRDGRWLSIIGGRRFNAGSELLWQLNRDGMPLYSLSLVMRSYFMEHEITHGSPRLYIEGGTSHPIRHSFTTETLTDLTAMRSSLLTFIVSKLARHLIPVDNELAKMFSAKDLVWSSPGKSKMAKPALL